MIASLLFYLFATVLVSSSLAVISSRNPVHSVLFLILSFFNAGALFVMLGAEFLAMLLVIVYVGAVAVLFLFVVMMLNVTVESFRKGLTKYFPASFAVAILLLGQMVMLFNAMPQIDKQNMKLLEATPTNMTNTEALGHVVYTDYILIFQLAGLVLLVAMIGAIVLTFTPRDRMRKQVINTQNARDPKKAIKMTNPEKGRGISS